VILLLVYLFAAMQLRDIYLWLRRAFERFRCP
jgi:hypothetical protein